MEGIVGGLLELTGSPWFLPALFVLVVGDALVPLLPSEAVVAALGALSPRPGAPALWAVVPIAAAGAIAGDSLLYGVGRVLRWRDPTWLHRPWANRAVGWVGRGLERRPAVLIITARYLPGGRQFVNLTAGATGFAYRRFLVLSAIAGATWGAYNALIGFVLGSWLNDQPLLAVGLSVGAAVGLGFAVDGLRALRRRRRARRPPSAD